MNSFNGIGRLTADPVVKTTTSGVPVVAFTLAINRPFKNKQTGEYDADFIRCVAYNRTAEVLGRYTRKGSQIGVEGWVQTRSYDDKDGKRVYVTEIITDRIHLLDPKDPNRNDYQHPTTYTYTQSATHTQSQENDFNTNHDVVISEDDLPF